MRKKKGKKIVSILAATIMTVSVIFGALASGSSPAYAAEFSADDSSVKNWTNYLKDENGNFTTENVGRIWTDKTVSTNSITFDGTSLGQTTVNKQEGSDFLVALSAISSTSNIMTKTDKPLDIVLVLDMSGSMGDPEIVYEYTPVYDLKEKETYYVDGGREVKWQKEIRFPFVGVIQEAGWYMNNIKVEPKTSASDDNSNHHQFYTRRETGSFDKENALKTAVNEFVNSTKKLNDGINDENKKHRIGLVKFAGNESETVGNNTYNSNRYNYSQIVNNLTSDMTQVAGNVSKLNPGGATRADLGMNRAMKALENSREGAQKVVIFFTDGQPNDGSGFDISVANSAISNAKSLKDTGTLVYSIGIFSEANPDIEDDNFNGFMHGVSSNYPEATAYNSLGARKEGSNYYKAATNADDLNKIFTEIAGEIQESAQGSPTQTQEGFESHSGYITFKDELGAYMKCDGFTDIIFAGKSFKNVSKSAETDKDGNTVTTYKFTGKGDNNLYPEGDLEDILINVTSYDDISKGDLVEVKIPATMIPVRSFHITEDGKMTVDETHPIRILYNASVKDGVIEDVMQGGKVVAPALIKNPDERFKTYLKNNITEDGKVKFFSNMWSGGDNGDTTATFEPAATNSFYKFTEDTQLFRTTDNGGKEAVNKLEEITISDKNEYFFEKSYYTAKESGGVATKKTERSYIRIGSLTNLNEWMYEKDGNVYIKKGTQRLLRINDFTNAEKGQSNKTGTAKYRINPVWDDTKTNIVVHLGNNGVVTAQAAGTLSIAKTAQIAEGLIGPVDSEGNSTLDEQKFTFEVTADTADGEYTSVVFTKNADGSETAAEASTVTFNNNKATVELKNKERIEIYGLKYGASFKVKETLQPAGFKQITPADNNAVTGTISEEMSRASFVNEYNASPVKDVTSAHLGVTGTKTLDGRTFESDDVFKFVITPSQDNPGTAQHDEYILTLNGDTVQGKNTAAIDFGTVSFDKPGQYIFRILEYLPGEGEGEEPIPSITYDSTNYRLTVQVKDNGEGKLEIESFNIRKRIDQQTHDWELVFESPNGAAADKGYINFTNTYNVNEQAISLRGIKQLDNKLLSDYGDVQFGFRIATAGSKKIGDPGEYVKDKNQPLPNEAVISEEGVCIYKNGSGTGLISMPNITFGVDDIGKEYKYIISELQPTKNGKMDGEPLEKAVKVGDKWTYKGITFDNTSTEITIKVQTTEIGGKDVIKATLTSSEPGPAFEEGSFNFVFNNTYDAKLTKEITLDGTKSIEGRSFAKDDSFTFKVEAQNGAPAPVQSEVTINPTSGKTQEFSFGNINFGIADMKGAVKQPDGTYKKEFTYKITEVNDNKAGFKYDTTPVMATVTVTDNGEGGLLADVSYTKNDSPVENATFTNTYESQLIFGSIGGLEVTKTLTGRDMRRSDAFEFKIKGIETDGKTSAAEAEAKLSNSDKSFKTNQDSKSGSAVVMKKLDAMRFTEADAGKTYSYEVAEVKGTLGGVTYDETKYVVAIEVIDNLDGTMHTVTTVTNGNDSKRYDSKRGEVPVVAFENRYKAADLTFDTADAQFEKSLIGREVNKDDSFTFKVEKASFNGETTEEALNNMPAPRDKEVTLVGEQINGKFSFGKMTFTKAGVYKYNVSEVIPEEKDKIPGITYDESVLSVTATVVDDGNGNLLVQQIEVPDNRFENRYDTNPVEYDTQGTTAETKFTKVLEGRSWKDDDLFAFRITPTEGAPAPKDENDSVVNYITVRKPDSGQSVDFGFGKITFDKEGEYIYKVKEIEPKAENMIPGINYDDHEATLKITVRDNQKGNLEVTGVELSGGTFTNIYDSQNVTVDPSAKGSFSKELSGRKWKDGETFDFTISPKSLDGKTDADSIKKIPMPKKTVATAEKPVIGSQDEFNFGSITFAEVGTYVYEVKENVPTENPKNGLTYDTHSEYMTIVVTDNNDGTKSAKVTLDDEPKFINTYKAGTGTFDPTKAETQFTKQLTGREWNDVDKFKFIITPENGAPAPAVSEVKVTKPTSGDKVSFNFGNIVFDAEGTYTYDVMEVIPADADPSKIKGVTYDNHHAKMTVKVTDNKDGALVATATFDKPDFVNKYKAASVDYNTEGTDTTAKFAKVLTGRPWLDSDSFTFNIKAKENAPMPTDAGGHEIKKVTVTKPENGNKANFGFGTIRFDEAGTYSYTVTEVKPEANKMIPGITYDEHEAILTIKVKDNKDGNLEIEHVNLEGGTFTNTYRADSVDVTPTDANAQLTKKLTGRDWKTQDNFSFTIGKLSVDEKTEGEAFDKMPLPKATQVTVAKPEKGNEATFAFGNIQFTKEGVYKYKVVENNAGKKIDGLTYSNNVATITVNVTDKDFDGALEAEVSVENPLFENKYKASATTVNTAKGLFTKQLVGRDSKNGEVFNFNITAVTEDAPMPNKATTSVEELENGVAKEFGFGTIEFKDAGTYVYNVVEENAGQTVDGLTYASNTAKMTITVTDNEDGTLSTDVKVENGLFENKYNAEVDFGKIGANFNITKSLYGRDMEQDQFSFELEALDADSEKALNIPTSGETVKSPAANMGEDAIVKVVDKLRFTEKDSNKTYGFTVRELGKAPTGYVYDETMYTVKIKIDDLANGKLKATAKVLAGEKLAGEYTWTPDSKDVKPVVLSFKNTYTADNNNSPAVVEATKTLNGRHLKAEEFNFQIKDVKGTVVREAKNAANGTVDFGEGFTYNINDLNEMVKNGLATKKVEDGKNVFTIPYTAEEVGNMPAGVTMTAGNFSFNIKVTDNGDGTLAADVVYPEGGIRFVNTYATGTDGNNEAPLQVIGNKVISAEDGLVPPAIDGKFSFTMTGDENAPLPEKSTVTNDGAGQITFGNIKYTLDMLKDVEPAEDGSRSRTFNYTVTESGAVPGITNDANNTRTFSVTLKDDGVGNLTATPSDSARFTFTNTYGVVATDPTSITDQIKISKKLTGRDLVAEEFKFELVDSKNKVVATGTNDAEGKIVFTPIAYDKPGHFTYTVREVASKEYDGVDYDETLFTVNTEVKDNSDGTMSVTHSVDGAEVVFNNKYSTGKTSVVIGAAKKFIGSDLKAGQFKFELKDEDGKLVSAAVNDKDGNIIFDEINYDKEGTYKYTISEVNSGDKNVKFDDTVFGVTVEVTDDKKGNLVAKAETDGADGVLFVNTYEKPQEPQTPSQSDDGAKTGDDTPINALVIFMGAAILLMGTLIERRKTN